MYMYIHNIYIYIFEVLIPIKSSHILPVWVLLKFMKLRASPFEAFPEALERPDFLCSNARAREPAARGGGQRQRRLEELESGSSIEVGDGHPTFNRNPYNGYINPYYWVDEFIPYYIEIMGV